MASGDEHRGRARTPHSFPMPRNPLGTRWEHEAHEAQVVRRRRGRTPARTERSVCHGRRSKMLDSMAQSIRHERYLEVNGSSSVSNWIVSPNSPGDGSDTGKAVFRLDATSTKTSFTRGRERCCPRLHRCVAITLPRGLLRWSWLWSCRWTKVTVRFVDALW